ncbi:prepilin-type N-terminal cleavage/methylation domain-containing protein [archaeon]|jgi:type IV pilus assembly protein PilA|nr:prepilin-type N-terminal cleavage/methylation domain-containing protein [archaeon]MBT7128788.1 prepilin-type N-terminal cleavage/methylation domain-containing protein [archaeon]
MKLMKRGHKGFTLIELMILIAIIGILVAVAIPIFSKVKNISINSDGQIEYIESVPTVEMDDIVN